MFYLLYIFTVIVQVRCYNTPNIEFDFMNIHCRDNRLAPVDWWFIYKPPQDTGSYFESGGNFTYILPTSEGRWKASNKFINSDSMLQYTLAPLYEKLFKDELAVMSYGEQHNFQDDDLIGQKSTSFGIMIANDVTALWIGHTVPGFPNFTRVHQVFPEEELSRGHMFTCLSVDLETLNAMTAIVRHTDPNILTFKLPDHLITSLPEWTLIETAAGVGEPKETSTKILNFDTREKSLRGIMLARSPEESSCLYSTFAKVQGIVMDVYSNTPYKQHPICEKNYSLRHIDSISLKFPEQHVYYINNKTDRTSFAVSTAAVWQRSGKNTQQYWMCAGNIDHQSPFPAKGGLIACVKHYLIWIAFDNLKVKEPTC